MMIHYRNQVSRTQKLWIDRGFLHSINYLLTKHTNYLRFSRMIHWSIYSNTIQIIFKKE